MNARKIDDNTHTSPKENKSCQNRKRLNIFKRGSQKRARGIVNFNLRQGANQLSKKDIQLVKMLTFKVIPIFSEYYRKMVGETYGKKQIQYYTNQMYLAQIRSRGQ